MPLRREWYSDSIQQFLTINPDAILGQLARNSDGDIEENQRRAWMQQIEILQAQLKKYQGNIYFEYSIPRMGKRVDTILIIGAVIFVLEFKVGEREYNSNSIDQVVDYALDLRNFHETSHNLTLAPMLIATEADSRNVVIEFTPHNDKLLEPILCNQHTLIPAIDKVLSVIEGTAIDAQVWGTGRYSPTPTIIEAAMALYQGHSVEEISRSDAGAINLTDTSQAISEIIKQSQTKRHKSICFITGVPGAGKTLVGLNIATKNMDHQNGMHSVFLSGNGPLVTILREALARDEVARSKVIGKSVRKGETMSRVKTFIQNVHHYRDEYLIDRKAPIDHVAIFDEAQRAWNVEQTSSFMRLKKKTPGFSKSEPEFLISCLNRHNDWATVVCLVGGGQEINTGEAGIGEWINSLLRSFPDWHIYISPRLTDSEYGAGAVMDQIQNKPNVVFNDKLHLSVSMRSFRAENVALLIKQLLDLDVVAARITFSQINSKYPFVLTRDLSKAKRWIREKARGSERYGIVVSSQAERLKPHAIDVKSPINPIHYFLNGKDDVRSSYYLEDVATEFHIQGLELDWACVTWDADFRFNNKKWDHWSFVGHKWQKIHKAERQMYQKNAYRVLLTRARQGMVIVVPDGDVEDATRKAEYYDPTFEYLSRVGIPVI